MRHRTVKGKEAVFEECAGFMITDPAAVRGRWGEVFGNDHPVSLEIGSGKGQFICAMAQAFPERNFIACEGLADVYVRIFEKIRDRGLTNLRVICAWMNEPLEYFEPGEVASLYINFCDPWPKKRHTKRRLTYRKRLEQYREILADGGIIEFKTDNDPLFDFSLEEFSACGMQLLAISRDLHSDPLCEDNLPTEYEEKYAQKGKSINFARVRV